MKPEKYETTISLDEQHQIGSDVMDVLEVWTGEKNKDPRLVLSALTQMLDVYKITIMQEVGLIPRPAGTDGLEELLKAFVPTRSDRVNSSNPERGE